MGTTGEVLEIGERALGALVVYAVEQRAAQSAYITQADAHRMDRRVGVPSSPRVTDRPRGLGTWLDRAVTQRPLHARAEHFDAVTDGVAHDGVRRVEAHRLRVQQRARELRRVVQLDPGTRVDEVGEAHRVALREPEVGKAFDLVHDVVGNIARDAAL